MMLWKGNDLVALPFKKENNKKKHTIILWLFVDLIKT